MALPGPKPAQYWRNDDLDQLRAAIIALQPTDGTWTPIVTPASGAITAYTASGAYRLIGKLVTLSLSITITTNGTGAGSLLATLPFTASASWGYFVLNGRENASTGSQLQGLISPNGTTATILTYNNAYPGGSGYSLLLSGQYFSA